MADKAETPLPEFANILSCGPTGLQLILGLAIASRPDGVSLLQCAIKGGAKSSPSPAGPSPVSTGKSNISKGC